MKPEFFQIERGCYKIGINPFMCGLTKKPVVRIECVEDNSITQDDDGEWIDGSGLLSNNIKYSRNDAQVFAQRVDNILKQTSDAKA